MRASIILANCGKLNIEDIKNTFLIGADRGALIAIENGLVPDISIGDFDSVTDSELALIHKVSKKVILLNPIKDKTDTDEALDLCNPYESITIYGGITGDRIEHFYANMLQLVHHKNLVLVDDKRRIETKEESFIPIKGYRFLSLFSVTDQAEISLSGMKYNLNHYILDRFDPLGVSNEIIGNPMVTIHSGRLFVFYSVDDHEKF